MTVTNVATLNTYAQIAQQTYDPDTGPTGSVAGAFGTSLPLIVPMIDGSLGFQARAFFNTARNKLVTAFT